MDEPSYIKYTDQAWIVLADNYMYIFFNKLSFLTNCSIGKTIAGIGTMDGKLRFNRNYIDVYA